MSTFVSSFKCNDYIKDRLKNSFVTLNAKIILNKSLPPIENIKSHTKKSILSPYKKRREAEKLE